MITQQQEYFPQVVDRDPIQVSRQDLQVVNQLGEYFLRLLRVVGWLWFDLFSLTLDEVDFLKLVIHEEEIGCLTFR